MRNPPPQREPRQGSTLPMICAALALLTVIAFWPITGAEFISFDDPDYVTDNPMVQRGLTVEGLAWAFTTGHSGNWHPLTWLSHMLDWQIYGPKAAGHHTTNLLFHLANSIILFIALQRMTRATWRSAVVAALFAVHPLHLESVAWVSERKDVLSTFFGLISLLSYIRHVQSGVAEATRRDYWFALVSFGCALLGKPMLVTLPFVFLLLDFWPLQRITLQQSDRRKAAGLVIEKAPFFAVSFISCAITFAVQRAGGAVRSVEEFSFWHRLGNTLISYATYLRKMVWPDDLAIFYPHSATLSAGPILVSFLIILGISVIAVLPLRSRPYMLIGWCWFLGTLVPVIGLVQVGEQALADRYSYIPLVGIFIAMTWWIGDLLARQNRLIKAIPAIVALAACALLTWRQSHVWQNNQTLFTHALAVTEKNYIAHNHLATDFIRKNQILEAREHLVRAVEYRPTFADALVNLGTIIAEEGNLAEAESLFSKAVTFAPQFEEAHYNLANLLKAEGQFTRAIQHYEEVLRSNPENGDAHSALGFIYANSGNMDLALTHFTKAAQLKPDDAAAQHNIGLAFIAKGSLDSAIDHLMKAVELNRDFLPAHYQLGIIFHKTGDTEGAIRHLSIVIQLDPENAEARALLETLKQP
jgi:Flp pilus assembly protein TadD